MGKNIGSVEHNLLTIDTKDISDIMQFVQRYVNSKTALNTLMDKKSRTMFSTDRFQVHVEGCLLLSSVQSTLGPYVCSVHPISAKSILYQSSPPNISAKSILYLPNVSYISQVKYTLYMLSPPYICHLLGNTNL